MGCNVSFSDIKGQLLDVSQLSFSVDEVLTAISHLNNSSKGDSENFSNFLLKNCVQFLGASFDFAV